MKRLIRRVAITMVFATMIIGLVIGPYQVFAAPPGDPQCGLGNVWGRCYTTGYLSGSPNYAYSGSLSHPTYRPVMFPLTTPFSYADTAGYPHWAFPQVAGAKTRNAVYANMFINEIQSYLFGNFGSPCVDGAPWLPTSGAYNPAANADNLDYIRSTSLSGLDDNGSTCYNLRANAVGASVIVNTMMGVDGSTFGNCDYTNPPATRYNCMNAGINNAKSLFPAWQTLVTTYNANGWVNWDTQITAQHGHLNTTGLNWGSDNEFYLWPVGAYNANVIQFTNPATGQVYTINRQCSNLIGDFNGLVIPPPPPTITCGNASTTPGIIQPGTTGIRVTGNDTYTGAAPAYTNFQVSIAGGMYPNTSLPVRASGNSLSFATPANLRAPPNAGSYAISWQLFDGANPVTPVCPGTINVVDLPYFSVFGGDVDAGGDFSPTCGTTGGQLESWYDNQAAIAGANTLFAAIANGQIYGFGSANARGGGGNPRPTGLTFANDVAANISTDPNTPKLGGNYGGDHCFYTPTVPSGTSITPGNSFNLNAASTGAYDFTAPQFTLKGGTVGMGNNLAVYVTGNVYISSNIKYAGSNGGWKLQAGGTNVPSFILEASGNIYIDPSVTNLDGIYVAHGTIYTCSDNSGFAPDTAANMYADCNNQLTVNGSFTANQINFMRTAGTLKNATSGENLSGGSKNCANSAKEPVCAAEIFNFSPEVYLSNPAVQLQNNGGSAYDAITSLPPVL